MAALIATRTRRRNNCAAGWRDACNGAIPMIRATTIALAGSWTGVPADRVVLDHDRRRKRRVAVTATGGTVFLLDLPKSSVVRHGDAYVLEDGRRVEIVAADEPLAEIVAADSAAQVRVAWHLGNRHLPTQIVGTTL